MDCIFCKIIKGEIPSYKIYEDNVILAFLDVNPYSPGHTLIVPKEHTLDIETIPEETINHIMKHAKDIAKLITKKLDAPGYTLVQNNGFVEEVKHFHLHIIPKYTKDRKRNIEEIYDIVMKSMEN